MEGLAPQARVQSGREISRQLHAGADAAWLALVGWPRHADVRLWRARGAQAAIRSCSEQKRAMPVLSLSADRGLSYFLRGAWRDGEALGGLSALSGSRRQVWLRPNSEIPR